MTAHSAPPMLAPFCLDVHKDGMLNDIWDTPQILRKIVEQRVNPQESGYFQFADLQQPLPASHRCAGRTPLEVMAACAPPSAGCFENKFTIIGSGTSWHAALVAEYLIENIARIPVEVQYASEFRSRPLLFRPGDVVFVVSSSGETWDAVESLKDIQKLAVGPDITVGVVNAADSTIGKSCDACIDVTAGKEYGVASTKSFSATVLSFVLLAMALAEARGNIKEACDPDELVRQLRELPDLVKGVLEQEARPLRAQAGEMPNIGDCRLWDVSCQNACATNFMFLGRGVNFPVALEGAMKCKEIAYVHAEGYPAAEMKHGPIALIDQFMPVVVISPRSDPTYEKIKANVEEVKTRSGAIVTITEVDNHEMDRFSEHVVYVPKTHEYLMPMIAVIPLQLLGYMMGTLRGNEVDNPRGLEKSVSKRASDGEALDGGYNASSRDGSKS